MCNPLKEETNLIIRPLKVCWFTIQVVWNDANYGAWSNNKKKYIINRDVDVIFESVFSLKSQQCQTHDDDNKIVLTTESSWK